MIELRCDEMYPHVALADGDTAWAVVRATPYEHLWEVEVQTHEGRRLQVQKQVGAGRMDYGSACDFAKHITTLLIDEREVPRTVTVRFMERTLRDIKHSDSEGRVAF